MSFAYKKRDGLWEEEIVALLIAGKELPNLFIIVMKIGRHYFYISFFISFPFFFFFLFSFLTFLSFYEFSLY